MARPAVRGPGRGGADVTESLLSVGIDIGTSTTQLVISRLTLENRANPFSVPRIAIAEREILYRSAIHFTPLLSDTVIDASGVRAIVDGEYQKSGFDKGQIGTGAVIITGETARKENAREVLSVLSSFAGDFVVATAGPDLESILAARGAGADEWSRTHHAAVLNLDIGGGTSNLALYESGELAATDCLNIGGRLLKLRPDGTVYYASPALTEWLPHPPRVGDRVTQEALAPTISALTEGLRKAIPPGVRNLSFSGGVADCMWSPPGDALAYGDIGVLLGESIRRRFEAEGFCLLRGAETIRATVVGAGAHSTDLSGSTIFYRDITFPLKNLPILKLTVREEELESPALAAAIAQKLRWYADEEGLCPLALGFRGEKNPSYARVRAIAEGVRLGLDALLRGGFTPVVVVESDMAKVLGQALAPLVNGPLLCLDGVCVDNGDYIDVGAPVAGGAVLPVVIKTLAFQKP